MRTTLFSKVRNELSILEVLDCSLWCLQEDVGQDMLEEEDKQLHDAAGDCKEKQD